MRYFVFFLFITLLFSNCKRDSREYVALPYEQITGNRIQDHPGKELMETHCYICHSPSAEMDELIAPPMAAVKAHYLMKTRSKGEFIEQIVSFVENPTVEKSEMPGAIDRFGVMPLQKFPENSVEQIAEYLFDYQVAEPDWFAAHWKAGPGSGRYQQEGQIFGTGRRRLLWQDELEKSKEKGIQIAMEAQQLLGQNLMRQIHNNGTLDALAFCNVQAIPLTDSVGNKFDATVQRVSDRYRNPLNAANSEEKALIRIFKREMAAGMEPQPVVKKKGDSIKFYYPLITNNLCLQCHGKQEDMDYAVKEKILQLYPRDQATGYSENEIRGIWKIEFKQ